MQGGDAVPRDEDHDRHLTLVDQTSGIEYDLWHVADSPLDAGTPTIHTEWSGVSRIDGQSAGLAGCIGANCLGEGNAGRYGNLAGRIRAEELVDAVSQHSFINHALTIAVKCTNGQDVYPAVQTINGKIFKGTGMACSDPATHLPTGSLTNVDAPPMGARLHLNLTHFGLEADLEQINRGTAFASVPEWKKVLLRTLVIYGAIINDTGSDFYFNWQTEAGNQYRAVNAADPWVAFAQGQLGTQANGQPFTDCWTGPASTDWVVACEADDIHPDGYSGQWKPTNDGVNWDSQVWSHLEVLEECANNGGC